MWDGLLFNGRAGCVGGGAFSHPALSGWFFRSAWSRIAALACSSRGVLSEKVGVRTRLAGGCSGTHPGRFHAHGSFRIVRAAVYAQTCGCMLQPRLVCRRVN